MKENLESKQNKRKEDPYIGRLFGDTYQVISLLGQGATTSVYKAKNVKLNTFVAIKILHFQFGSNEGTVRRFEQEIKTISRLKHANIVCYYDSGVGENDEHYLVMEYADGVSLRQLLKDSNSLDWKRTLPIFLQILAALGAAHQNGVIHRDLKPANIIITRDAQGKDLVKLLDFGVAKLLIQGETFQTRTQTGEMLGTLLYMSPEQCLDQDLDGRSDIYSLGCVLFETLTGTPPFTARTAFETMNLHLTSEPGKLSKVRPDLALPKQLDTIIQKAVAKDQKHRYQTVMDMAEDLTKVEKNLPVLTVKNNLPARSNLASQNVNARPSTLKFLQALYGTLFCVGFPLMLVDPLSGQICCGFGFVISLATFGLDMVPKKKDANSENTKVIKITTSVSAANSDRLDLEKFAKSVFDRVDTNKDGFITRSEMQELLKTNRASLTGRELTFVQFVLEHFNDFEEIFDDQGEQIGISRQAILQFARTLPEIETN